jgi:hypothetical protein
MNWSGFRVAWNKMAAIAIRKKHMFVWFCNGYGYLRTGRLFVRILNVAGNSNVLFLDPNCTVKIRKLNAWYLEPCKKQIYLYPVIKWSAILFLEHLITTLDIRLLSNCLAEPFYTCHTEIFFITNGLAWQVQFSYDRFYLCCQVSEWSSDNQTGYHMIKKQDCWPLAKLLGWTILYLYKSPKENFLWK